MSIKIWTCAIACALGLSACGNNLGDQALAGSAVGAGVAAIASGSLIKGAAVGAAGNIVFCQLYPHKCN